MLDTKDLEAIAQLMDLKLTDHTVKMERMMDSKLTDHTVKMERMMDSKLTDHTVKMEQMMDSKLTEQKSELLSVMAQQRKEIVEETMHNMQVLLEAEVTPKFNLLVDGQQTLLDTLASKSRVEALEDEVSFLKQMLKTLASEVDNLKKAN